MRDLRNITQADLQAADAVVPRISGWAETPPSRRDEIRNFYASLHANFGADKFALRFGLRKPNTPLEELEFSFFTQQISEEEYVERFTKHASRSIDEAMLEAFFAEYQTAVQEYGNVLQLIVQIATNQREPNVWRRREPDVDVAVDKLNRKFELSSAELMTVHEFLTLVQSDRVKPIDCAGYTGDSAHWVAVLAFSHTSDAWKSCKAIARRSRRDPRYLYPTHASALFFKTLIDSNKLPRPNDLAALMRIERAKALAKLRDTHPPLKSASRKPARTVQPIHFEDFGGHQFERLVFAYHLRTERWRSLEWYGQSGSDLGRDIWGERIAGGTLCVQCVNRKTTTAAKLRRDLDKIVRAMGGVPDAVLIVCTSSVSAKLRDKLKTHAQKSGITRCDIWSGQEFEERLRSDTESLLKRFVDGETFPDDPDQLRRFADSQPSRRSPASKPESPSINNVIVQGSNNGGVVANHVTIRDVRSRRHAIILPGSIGANAEQYNYVEYLIKKLAEFREAGAAYGQPRSSRVHPGSTRKILEKQLGGLPKDLPGEKFTLIVAHIQAKIENTALGRKNHSRGLPSYHSFEQHLSLGDKSS